MYPTKAADFLCVALLFSMPHGRLIGAPDTPENPPATAAVEAPSKILHAPDKAIVKDIVYGLEAEENRLFITSQPLEGADRQLKRQRVKFNVPEGDRFVELALAKMNGKNLMAVLKVRHGDEFDFYCLTFIGPWGGGHVRDQDGRCFQAKFFTTRDDLEILAISGKGGRVFIVVGEMGENPDSREFEWITEGIFYFSGCPWPPSDGSLTPFRVKAAPPARTD